MPPLFWKETKIGPIAQGLCLLGNGQQVPGGVDMQFHIGILQFHQAVSHIHLVLESTNQLLPYFVHLLTAVLLRVLVSLH